MSATFARTLFLAAAGIVLTAGASRSAIAQTHSDTGLDERPSNVACFATESPAPADITLERQFPNLAVSNLTALAQASGNGATWYFATRDGLVGRFANDPAVSSYTTVLDLRTRVVVPPDGGLIQLVFHPDFPADPRVFVNYSEAAIDGVSDADIVLSSFSTPDNGLTLDPASEIELIRQPRGAFHQGGYMAFDDDGLLHIGLGDGTDQGDPTGNGQNTGTFLGKVLRIDIDGAFALLDPHRQPVRR